MQASRLAGIDTTAAADGNPQLKQFLDAVKIELAPQVVGKNSPFIGEFTVIGQDGSFIVDITPAYLATPKSQTLRKSQASAGNILTGQTLQHQLRCADDLQMTVNVITYGPDPRTHWEIPNPDVRKFWQLRSTYDQQNWNDWLYFIDPATCGPVRVWSGQVRSTSMMPNVPPNTTNFCTVDSVDDGAGHATIRVYGSGGVGTTWGRQVGATVFTGFAAGTLTGYIYATKYYVIYDTQSQIFRVFDTTSYPSILPDPYVFCGTITTVGAGGGGGAPGGGGGGGGPTGCTEVGTALFFDGITESVNIETEECNEWIGLRFLNHDTPLMVHPDTMVGVWRKARLLSKGELVDVGENGEWLPLHSAEPISKKSSKQKLKVVPHRTYRAGSRKVKLHNMKALPPD